MPFSLKVAPSLFQKAIVKIYEPLLNSALVYIVDILLFSSNIKDHEKLLQQFADLTKKFEVMLSLTKMYIGKDAIEFSGMQFNDGNYQPGPHIASELQHFSKDNLLIK